MRAVGAVIAVKFAYKSTRLFVNFKGVKAPVGNFLPRNPYNGIARITGNAVAHKGKHRFGLAAETAN